MTSKKHFDILERVKAPPPERLRAEGHGAMVRLAEQKFAAEKLRIAAGRRLEPVYGQLGDAIRADPKLAGVVRAIETHHGRPHRGDFPRAAKSPFAPAKTLVRVGSIHVVDSLPFYSDTWLGQDGTSNDIFEAPSADGNSGLMQFGLEPGTSSSGSASCWAALGATVAIPNSQCLINFSANPSYTWQYWESSSWWRQAAGNMWIGLYVGLFDAQGTFLGTAVSTNNTLASFDDRNFLNSGQNEGQSSGDTLSAQTFIGSILGIDIDEAAEGGFLQYWCWIGGSCNSDGSNDQSFCIIQMSANCSSLVVDIFPNE